MSEVRCDGLWPSEDKTTCAAKIVLECDCRRCQREIPDGQFHACADRAHQAKAAERHRRTYDRACEWLTVGATP